MNFQKQTKDENCPSSPFLHVHKENKASFSHDLNPAIPESLFGSFDVEQNFSSPNTPLFLSECF